MSQDEMTEADRRGLQRLRARLVPGIVMEEIMHTEITAGQDIEMAAAAQVAQLGDALVVTLGEASTLAYLDTPEEREMVDDLARAYTRSRQRPVWLRGTMPEGENFHLAIHAAEESSPAPEPESTAWRWSARRIADAALVWSAAAGTAGAYLPPALADEFEDLEEPDADDILLAVRDASTEALARQREENPAGPPPRGLAIEIQPGELPVIIWETGRHRILLYSVEDATLHPRWWVTVEGPAGSDRIAAAAEVAAAIERAYRGSGETP